MGEVNNNLNIFLLLTMRKMKLIYQEVKGEEFFMLKKKLQKHDKTVSGKYVQVKNSVEAFLKLQGQKPIEENKSLLAEDYFVKLIRVHADAIGLDANNIIG